MGKGKLTAIVVVGVLVVATVGGAAYLILLAPRPAETLRIEFSRSLTETDQGAKFVLSVTVRDPKGVDRTDNAKITWSATPSDLVELKPSEVGYSASVAARKAGDVKLSVRAQVGSTSGKGEFTLKIHAVHFALEFSKTEPLVGEAIVLNVRALRPNAAPAVGYDGKINFTADDYGRVVLPSDKTMRGADSGSLAIVVKKAGNVRITARDTVLPISSQVDLFGNRAPKADFAILRDPENPRRVTLDASNSSDEDEGDSIRAYAWTLGDGGRAEGKVVDYTYARPGKYPIRLTVRDSHGGTNSRERGHSVPSFPVASFIVTHREALEEGLRIEVEATESFDIDGFIRTFSWTWGDGTSNDSANKTFSHTYASSLADQILVLNLSVLDNEGLAGRMSMNFKVTPLNIAPVADFRWSVNQVNRTIQVDAGGSSDLNGDLRYYNWSWGDGTWTNGTRRNVSHHYRQDGGFEVSLRAIDLAGLEASKPDTINIALVNPQPPRADFKVIPAALRVEADGGTSVDPNEDIELYQWDWGDGTPKLDPSEDPRANHTYSGPGVYAVTLNVKDSKGLQAQSTKKASVAASTIHYDFYDFFDVPYKQVWDYRSKVYGDRPINAECFNQTSIDQGVCVPSNPEVPDLPSYPYTNWYPLPGALSPTDPLNNPLIYAPYRMNIKGVNVPGYNLSEPVFLPVLNYSQAPGERLEFRWRFNYVDRNTADALNAQGCPISGAAVDGFQSRSLITLVMDLQQSRRTFNVQADNPTGAQAWWDNNILPGCALRGRAESALQQWFVRMGGGSTIASVGKYDIANSFEWYYQPYYTQMWATVDPATGVTTVNVDMLHWGTEVLMARWFYWGNASYRDHYLDSTKARGWWGMELAWFEDFDFQGALNREGFDFRLSTVMQYHFWQLALPGPNGLYDRLDDVPYWTWVPFLSDYTNDWSIAHLLSELDRYNGPDGVSGTQDDLKYVHSTSGGSNYGKSLNYDYAPVRWDLALGQTWHFQLPLGNVVFYDPNLTPVPSTPQAGGFVSIYRPMEYSGTSPANYGVWDPLAKTWDVYGPSATGGPSGSPGNYALGPWGALELTAEQP